MTTEPTISLTALTTLASPQLLMSAIVGVLDCEQNSISARALLDTCATANFITETLAKRLRLNVTKHSMPIGAINSTNTVSKGLVKIVITSIIDGFSKELTCLTIPNIAELIPSEVFPRDSLNIPGNIRLADPKFHLPRPVDLLIAAGATTSLLSVGQINLSYEGFDVYLQKTRLGWVVTGGTTGENAANPTCHLTTLEDQVQRFWTIEEIHANKPKSSEEMACENHFRRNVSRDKSGRYIVRLPFRESNERLGESRSMALKRLMALERKLNTNATLKLEYTRIIEEYLELGQMSVVETPCNNGYYMPHHPVFKENSNTTKVRIVFDASAKTSKGISLNDTLMVGPTIQDKLFAHLIRFRTYKYVITADIEKMYRQVQLHEDDRRFQQILWRRNGDISTLQLNTLTFDVSSSPFLAIRTVQQLVDDEGKSFPRAAKVLKSELYVDDLLSGANTIDEARTIRKEVSDLLKRGGFVIRQWAANDKRILDGLADSELHANFVIDLDHMLKTLGITWNARTDFLCYAIHSTRSTNGLTKRIILSEIAKIFDPLGLMGPVVLFAKRLMQDVWRCGVQWDESVPQGIYTEWTEFTRQMDLINQISFERKLLVDNYQEVHLHGFCDASNTGYGACLYVRSSNKQGNVVSRLMCAKSRVAPLKTVTIPRLELCGALLLARLYREVRESLDISFNKIVFWSDSTIVLHWLKTSPHALKTYVGTRVAEIQEIAATNEWRHVRSEENPADAVSRGQLPHSFAQNKTWFTGPSWLGKGEHEWPDDVIQATEIPELRLNACLVATIGDIELLQKFSSYSKLCRVVAYCLRFRAANRRNGPLQAEELQNAETRVLKILQAVQFSEEIRKLKDKQVIKRNKINNLNPFLDETDILRVGGRLHNSKLTFKQKHPILLPSRHHLTEQIIRETHETFYHTGIQATLSIIRQKFWLLDGRNQVRSVIRTCTRCSRFNANEVEYRMGTLPPARVCEAMPFENTGVDFCGPFFIKEKKYRNKTRIKTYICVFVCMAVKAIHLEIVSDLSTDGFLAALRRFTARRGLPSHIYSDNGTNFIGANNKLKELYALFNSDQHKEQVSKYSSNHRITWHFIPPAAPHFGGLWESTVKLFKHHFRRVVGELLLTFEELNTFATEIEGILNSRPITSISSDPNDMFALTPGHFLIGRPLTTLPEGNLTYVPANRLSTWQHISKMRQDFWARWNLEYLNELQKRHKWTKDGPKLEVGTVVLIKDKTLPCSQWLMGRITTVHPGADGVIRTATVKTASGELKRTAKVLCPLPIEQPSI